MRIDEISRISTSQAQGVEKRKSEGVSFEGILREETEKLKFSAHAVERIERRRIEMNGDRIRRLMNAVERAREKGGKEAVIIIDGIALLVSIEKRTVITAIDSGKEGGKVFTQIDSVVLA